MNKNYAFFTESGPIYMAFENDVDAIAHAATMAGQKDVDYVLTYRRIAKSKKSFSIKTETFVDQKHEP